MTLSDPSDQNHHGLKDRVNTKPRMFMRAWVAILLWTFCAAAQDRLAVDFRYAPPQWQTAICLPDDAQKTLVDHTGRLLYDFRDGTRFNLTVGVNFPGAKLVDQRLANPRVPIVVTTWKCPNLEIVQHAFAVTRALPRSKRPVFVRRDNGKVLRGWARVGDRVNPLLASAAINEIGPLLYQLAVKSGSKRLVAVAVSEGFWTKPGMRMLTMMVEGAESTALDAVGQAKVAVRWFDAADTDNDGQIDVKITGSRGAIVNGLWAFSPTMKRNTAALVRGDLDPRAEALTYAADRTLAAPRCDAILVNVTNTSNKPVMVTPTIAIESLVPLRYDPADECLQTGSHEAIRSSLTIVSAVHHRHGHTALLRGFELVPHESRQFHVTRTIGNEARPMVSLVDARKFWLKQPLPYGRITVPDPQVQALLDSSIRNIRQAREISNGLPVFQVGPTCYRNLWIIDAAFILEAVTTLGDWKNARKGIAHVLSCQQKDGRFELIERGHKENGIVLWTCVRHARLTRDKQWLRSVWPRLRQAADHIKRLRKQALTNDTSLDDGLIPAGFVDGGLPYRDRPDLSNTYWCLIGLKAAIEGGDWIGEKTTDLRREFDSYLAAFRKVAKREMRPDPRGRRYLPILLGKTAAAPEKGQWTFLQALHPGELFSANDPIVAGNMAVLQVTEREGMVTNTGWLDGGIWTYFASFYGHAWLRLGNGGKAAKCLYAMANHAAPTLVWQEEQPLKGQPYRRIGDMPHNWASAEFIRLTVHLLAFERGNELHLLEGLPNEWLKPGMVTKLDGILTKFGPLIMSLTVAKDGKTAKLDVKKLDTSCKAIVVHLPDGTTQRLKADADQHITCSVEN